MKAGRHARFNKFLIHVKKVAIRLKNLQFFDYLVKTYTNEGDTVLDCCMGCGSTGLAAINLKRKFIGIEICPKYYNIAVKRFSEIKNE